MKSRRINFSAFGRKGRKIHKVLGLETFLSYHHLEEDAGQLPCCTVAQPANMQTNQAPSYSDLGPKAIDCEYRAWLRPSADQEFYDPCIGR